MAQERTTPKSNRYLSSLSKPYFIVVAIFGLLGGALLFTFFIRAADSTTLSFCSLARSKAKSITDFSATPIQLQAIVHYATSRVTPQQSLAEISVSFNVLKTRSPCNFLVFGLGHDSLMWDSINPRGTTIFLEEDPKWVQTVLKDAPTLRAYHVPYQTQMSQADRLFQEYRSEPDCLPARAFVRGNEKCKLALTTLPDEVYETEWDLIMIDAPRGYFAEAPGRMGAIFSAAVMARQRKGEGVTHVFLHDINRKVEKMYAEEFLCRKYLVKAVGRLWHFEIPAVTNVSGHSDRFC